MNLKNLQQTLTELLRYRADSQPDKMAYIFLEDGDHEAGSLTYKELDERAKSIAGKLQALGLEGERALLIYNSDLEYISAFFGCLYAGVISVPLHPPGKNKSLSRISAIAIDSDAKVILSVKDIQTELENDFSKDSFLKNVVWINTNKIQDEFASGWKQPGINADTLAYLQYTSGSTGTPKGVMVSHKNLLHNLSIIDKCHPHNVDSVMVTWLPIFHDMGLIYGILLPFYGGYPCYFMTPQAFVQKPFRWLKAITKYKGTHNAAPNFAFELCINKITDEQKEELDLSTWTVAMNAAEPVRAETIVRFVEHFKDCGFNLNSFAPGYGLAEGTLILSTTFASDEPAMNRFDDTELEKNNTSVISKDNVSKIHVGHSHSIEDTRIAIVDPVTFIECKEGEVGEVWASGISIAQGYWKREEATKETFKAYIAETKEGPFMRTGDLGFIKDNELYITGRHKDLIIIRGQNHYPQDIEYTVESSHPALRLGCVGAFSYEVNGEEQIGIVQEVQKNFVNDINLEEVSKSILSAVSKEHDLHVHSITLIQPGTVPKTSSGKIQRKACLQGYLDETLDKVAEWKNGEIFDFRSEILDLNVKTTDINIENKLDGKLIVSETQLKEWLVKRLSELMQIKAETINIKDTFSSMGIDSLKAVELSGDLETLLKRELPSTLVYDYPTIEQLARYLNYDENFLNESYDGEMKGRFKDSSLDLENEPIAIIGIGLRFPDANNASEFWGNLINGKDSIRQIPDDRWNKNNYKNSTVTYGGFVDGTDKFDPGFFGISPREAIQIDPQQRFALEVSWEAFEDAGIDPETLAGKNVGVFMGICTYDYARYSAGKNELFDVYTGTGTSLSIAANRLSYFYDFRGPSIAIDTACSSSLVAVHTACQSIRSGQSGIALAGGVNLILAPDWNVVFTEADMLAPDGKCKTFDADADGYVRSEGCGIVVLKKLSEAVKDGDRIYSVIKGSAINQDGKSNGLTAPNGPSQEDVIKSALINAGVKANEISYLETHGTGTPLGDPIEVNSLERVMTDERSDDNTLHIGSVKTNIGHLEAAAGIAGLIKTSLALYNKEIPGSLNFKKINPEINIENKPVKIADKNIPWIGDNRSAGISSFGFGGTNAHVILSEAPELKAESGLDTKSFNIFTLSAKSDTTLHELAERYIEFLETNPDADLEEICYTANIGRASHNHRLAVICESNDNLKKKLSDFKKGKPSNRIIYGNMKVNHVPKVAFLFPGQGAQFIGMGKELYDNDPLFREIINKCDEILRKYLDKSLLEVLFYEKDEKANPINETTYTQPALFALEYALAKLWMSYGILPSVMMGHSAGEYVAACLAGVFSLEDGLKLVTERGRLMQTLTDNGEMYTIFADEETTKKELTGFEDSVSVASINGPFKTVISGKKSSLEKIIPGFDAKQIEYKKINVSIASHSPLMNKMIDEFRKVCNSVEYSSPSIPVVSNITGQIVTDRISNPDYWCEHVLSAVRFSDGIKACVNYGCEIFIDLGPKPTSINMGQETVTDADIKWLPSIKYNFTILEILLQGLGTLFANGIKADWKNYYRYNSHKKISLPLYPFQKQRYWITDLDKAESRSVLNFQTEAGSTSNQLAGRRLLSASDNEFIFSTTISGSNPEYLKDHCVFGKIVMPGAAYIEMVMTASGELNSDDNICLSDIKFHQALILEHDTVKNIQTIITKSGKNENSFRIFSLSEDDEKLSWILHCSGEINFQTNSVKENQDPEDLKNNFTENIPVEEFYNSVRQIGINYSNGFRGIKELSVKDRTSFAEIELDNEISDINYFFHPAILDSSFQTALILLLKNRKECSLIPVGIDEFYFSGKAGRNIRCIAELADKENNINVHKVNFSIYSKNGNLIAYIKGFQLKEVTGEEFLFINDEINKWFYEVVWEKQNQTDITAEYIPDTAGIKKYTESKLSGLRDKKSMNSYREGVADLNNICLIFIVNALKKLGMVFEKRKLYDKNFLLKDLNIAEKNAKIFIRLIKILGENDIISIKGDQIEIKKNIGIDPTDEIIPSFSKKYPELNAEATLVLKCGDKLHDVLTGKTDVLELLFPGADFSAATSLYQESPGFTAMNDLVKYSVESVLNKFNTDKKIRILEIGAGTGSTTASILPLLGNRDAEFTFSDVSQLFINKAKSRFKNFKFINYKLLDIERDPLEQEFEEGYYDMVIASNVIHAAKDLSEATGNIRKILKANGLMILNEVTKKQNWIDITFGLTEGWWRFEDILLRKSYPLLNRGKWKNFLENSGFASAKTVSPSGKSRSFNGQTLIIAKSDNYGKANKGLKELGHILIFAGNNKQKKYSQILKKRNQNFTVVTDADSYKKNSEKEYSINYSDKDDFKRLFKEIAPDIKGDLKIVYSNTGHKTPPNIRDIGKLSDNGCVQVLNIIQTISGMKFSNPPKLFIMTNNVQTVTGKEDLFGLSASPLWGMGKVISLEHPEFKCRLIDTDAETNPELVTDEILASSEEEQVAFRNNERYVPRLIRRVSRQDTDLYLDDKSTYLITGGLGGLGILTAKWLADNGAKHIALTGRSDNSNALKHKLDEIKEMNVSLNFYKADITKREDIENVLKEIKQTGFSLKGIIHSAGVLDDGVILNQDKNKFDIVMGPKVLGAFYLHELTQESELDFFVMYSSVASLLGSAGQANHSAANAFLDSLSHYRRSKDLPALSINWGVWSDIGSAASRGADLKEKITGMSNIDPVKGISALNKVMRSDAVQTGVFPMDWSRYPGIEKNKYFSRLIQEKSVQIADAGTPVKEDFSFISKLKNAAEEEYLTLLTEYFRELISRIMGLDADDLETELPLNMMGLDSLMAIELKNNVNTDLGIDLNLVRYMEETNILNLAEELIDKVPEIIKLAEKKSEGDNNSVVVSEEEKTQELLANLDDLSEEELDRLINETK